MILFAFAYLGGVLTILSPCVLPVLPFVFARADQPFFKSGLPLLIGMALTFTLVATLAAVGGGWVVHANQIGRIAAMIILAFFGLTLVSRTLADMLTRPLVALGNRLSKSADSSGGGVWASLLLGVATGFLWAPCAGPILGLVLTGAALQGASASTTLLLLAYGAGAATSLGAALQLGGRVFVLMKKSLGAGEWVRRGLGVLVLAGVAAIALGLDTGFLSRLSTANTSRLEQSLLSNANGMGGVADSVGAELRDLGPAPDFTGATTWINSQPLTAEQLRGHTVLVDFWTYSCINCLRSLPYARAWETKYRADGLIVVGVHAPEFAFERDERNVRQAVHDLGIVYPVAMDNNFAIWRAFHNRFWPQHYLIDAHGHIRYVHSGEGEYEDTEHALQALLVQDGQSNVPMGVVNPNANGALAEASTSSGSRSPETYVGYARARNFASGEQVHDAAHAYILPAQLALNQWGITGSWSIAAQPATANSAGSKLIYRFRARDLHLVMGPGAQPVRIRVRVDGQAPGLNHGTDLNAAGEGVVNAERLYQLLRFPSASEHTFEIEFLDPGAQVFSLTFG
jgi:cytochrome c biogenesis protein CcdA/thiol-disulfide isomerase/thioredoxin